MVDKAISYIAHYVISTPLLTQLNFHVAITTYSYMYFYVIYLFSFFETPFLIVFLTAVLFLLELYKQ